VAVNSVEFSEKIYIPQKTTARILKINLLEWKIKNEKSFWRFLQTMEPDARNLNMAREDRTHKSALRLSLSYP